MHIDLKRTALLTRSTGKIEVMIAIFLSLLVTWSVMHSGIPALRQDWWFPSSGSAMQSVVHWYADGWSPYGFGSVQPYPTFYPLALLWQVTGLQLVPFWGLCVCIFSTILLISYSAMSFVPRLPWCASFAISAFASANPWVYTEYRAGHIYMVLGYAVMLALLAETRRAQPRISVVLLLCAFSVIQIEFSVIVTVPLLVWLIRKKYYRAILVLCAFLIPIIIGIVASFGTIAAIPYGLDWQRSQSVHLADGFLLRGYAYGVPAVTTFEIGTSVVFAFLAVVGCIRSFRRWQDIFPIVCAFAVAVYASGLSGFFGYDYAWIVTHMKVSGLFRELYDLISFVALAYIIALAAVFRHSRNAATVGAIAGIALLLPWIMRPISDGFIARGDLPHVAIPADPAARVALFPAFQPMSYRGRGYGTDPDAFVDDRFATPLNEWFPTFPVNAALAYAASGDYSWVKALGVSSIISRPYLSNRSDMQEEKNDHLRVTSSVRFLHRPMPLFAWFPSPPQIVSIGDRPDEYAIFFGDVSRGLITKIEPSVITHDPTKAWVDARIEVASHPQEASAFGGVVTVSRLPLTLPNRVSILARAEGRLMNQRGQTIVNGAHRLRWYRLPRDTAQVVCEGRCTVALAGDPPRHLVDHAVINNSFLKSLSFHRITPWLSYVSNPMTSSGYLRYNVRYDKNWIAISNFQILEHLRLDTAVNAWKIPNLKSGHLIVIVHATSLIQAIFEWLAFCMLIFSLYGVRYSRFSHVGDLSLDG